MSLILRRVLQGALSATLAVPLLATAQFLSDPDENWREAEVEFPPPPQEAFLREFFVSSASSNRSYVDESSLEVGSDYVVRFVLVTRTSGGAENVSFEGIRCTTGERKLYALGRPDGEWTTPRRSEWQTMRTASVNTPQTALAINYLCDGPAPPRTTEDALRTLRTGVERGWSR